MECCGLVTTVYDDLLTQAARTLGQVDQMRSARRGYREDLVNAGLSFEERLLALESGKPASDTDTRLRLMEARLEGMGAPKQLTEAKTKKKGKG